MHNYSVKPPVLRLTQTIEVAKEEIANRFNAFDKRIILVALAILACAAAIYALYRHFSGKITSIDKPKSEDKEKVAKVATPAVAPKIDLKEIAKDATNLTDVKQKTRIPEKKIEPVGDKATHPAASEKEGSEEAEAPSESPKAATEKLDETEITQERTLAQGLTDQIRGALAQVNGLIDRDLSKHTLTSVYIDSTGKLHGIVHRQKTIWLDPVTEKDPSKLFAFNLKFYNSDEGPAFSWSRGNKWVKPHAVFELPEPMKQLADQTIAELNRMAAESFQICEKARQAGHLRRQCDWSDILFQSGPLALPPEATTQKTMKERMENNCQDALRQQEKEKPKLFELASKPLSDVVPQPTPSEVTLPVGSGSKKAVPIVHDFRVMEACEVGAASCEGRRDTMEDTDLIAWFHGPNNGDIFPLFAVCDGHGGPGASEFVQKNLAQCLRQSMIEHCSTQFDEETIGLAIKECFKKLDQDYQGREEGTTVVMATIINNRLYVANTGDSRAVIVTKEGKAVQASEDAKPDMFEYKRKIEEAGGKVVDGKVNGRLSVARAIGDHSFIGTTGKKCVLPNPKITSYALDSFDYLILACDGFFDMCSSNELGAAIAQMHQEGKDPQEIAKAFVYTAVTTEGVPFVSHTSNDNVTLLVIRK